MSDLRRHPNILAIPGRGHQPPTWGYLLELLVQEESIVVTADHQLLPQDADRLAGRMVLLTSTVREAFTWLARHGLVAIRKSAEGHVAAPDLAALAALLRKQQELELAGARASETEALVYLRARSFWVRLPWLRRVLGKESE